MNTGKLIIVDENDNIVGYKTEAERKPGDIARVSGLWITNDKGQILLAQRSYSKKHNPGQWAAAVAGTLEEGETYESNIIKESEEELGIKNITPVPGPKKFRRTSHSYFVQMFTANLNIEISNLILQKEEVERVQWFDKEQLLKETEKYPEKFSDGMAEWLNLLT